MLQIINNMFHVKHMKGDEYVRFNLIKFRKKLKLSQEEISEMLDISRPYYSDIETGKANPNYNLMVKFGEIFKNKYDDIWELFKKEE